MYIWKDPRMLNFANSQNLSSQIEAQVIYSQKKKKTLANLPAYVFIKVNFLFG